eukprot:scaffold24470_cov60-Phaeocystis_antarctica.AAC.2
MQLGTGLKRCRAASNLNPSPKPDLIRTLTLAPTLILTREWARVSLELSSTRELRYKKLSAPPLEAAVAMRDATEVRVGDNLQSQSPVSISNQCRGASGARGRQPRGRRHNEHSHAELHPRGTIQGRHAAAQVAAHAQPALPAARSHCAQGGVAEQAGRGRCRQVHEAVVRA